MLPPLPTIPTINLDAIKTAKLTAYNDHQFFCKQQMIT